MDAQSAPHTGRVSPKGQNIYCPGPRPDMSTFTLSCGSMTLNMYCNFSCKPICLEDVSPIMLNTLWLTMTVHNIPFVTAKE